MSVDATGPGGWSAAHDRDDSTRREEVIHNWERQALHVGNVCVGRSYCTASLNVDTLTSFCTIIVTVQPLAPGESRITSTDVQARHL